jgi:gas vesicle protein
MSDDRNSFMDAMGVLGTLTVGALLGAGVALLLAPKSGAELREELRAGAERIESELGEATHKAGESVRAQVDKLTASAAELTKKAEELGQRLAHPEQPAAEAAGEAPDEA